MKSATRTASFGPFRLTLTSKQLRKDGVLVPMGGRALELLVTLVENAGTVLTKQQLLASAWPDLFVEEANLRVQMTALRRVLGDGQDGRHYIANVARRGYSFVAEVAFSDAADGDTAQPRMVRQNLPLNLTPVLGRETAVAAISRVLVQSRFVSVVGPGGVGKTTVALDVARAMLAQEEGAGLEVVILVELALISNRASVENAIASAIGMTLGSEPVRLSERLPFGRALLILDNCEQVLDAAASLAELVLGANPELRVLITSREPLRGRGERILRLPGLAMPPRETVGLDALAYPAVQLFVERAAATLGSYEPTADDLTVITGICRRLDGMPLAIELAAGRVDAFGIMGLAQRLDDMFRLLVDGRRTALPRHQTLHATLNWSYDHLSAGEQITLCRLAVFAGHFSLDAASKVAAIEEPSWDVIEHLTSLVSKSLIAADFSQIIPRYHLLEVTRAYALGKLRQNGELDRLRRRHALYMKDLLAVAEQEWPHVQSAVWLATYAGQLDNVRAALDWCLGSEGDREIGITITIASAVLWFQLSLVDECRAQFERARACLEEGMPLEPSRHVALLSTLGTALVYTIGPGDEARALIEGARQVAREAGSPNLELQASWAAWLNEFCSGSYDASLAIAREFAERAGRCGQAGQAADLVVADRLTGISLLFLGRVDDARRMLESALGGKLRSNIIVRMQYDQELNCRAFYSAALYLSGLQDQASALAARNIADAVAHGHATTLALNLVDSGCPVAFYCGEADALAERLEVLADVSSRHAFGPWRAWCRCYRGSLHFLRGAFTEAAEDLTAGINALETTRWPIRRAMFLGHCAEALSAEGRRAEALANVGQAIDSCRASGEGWILPDLLRIRAGILAPEKPGEARADLDEGWCLAQQTGLRSWGLRIAISATRLNPQERRYRQRLSDVAASFTEGYVKADYRTAHQLLGSSVFFGAAE